MRTSLHYSHTVLATCWGVACTHPQERIRTDIINWMKWLRQSIGFDGWRFDFVRGYPGTFCKQYVDATGECGRQRPGVWGELTAPVGHRRHGVTAQGVRVLQGRVM